MPEDRDHVSRELLKRFFRAELSRRDTREVVLHLIRHCDECLERAVQVGAEEGYMYSEGDFRALQAFDHMDEAQAELARERLRGIGLWVTLERHDQERRLAMIRDDPRMHTWGLYDRLLEKSRETSFRSPTLAAKIAQLALAVVETLDSERYGAKRLADFRAGALAAFGNARRLGSDFEGAENAFRAAREELRQGTGDRRKEADLLCLEANLHKDLGRFEQAGEFLEVAIATYKESKDTHLEGRTILKMAGVTGYVDPEKAVKLAQDGLALIDIIREPRLELCGRHALAFFLNEAGHSHEALALLEDTRPLYAQFKDPWTRTRLHWLEGKIARSLGDLAEAEEVFKRLWFDLQEPSYAHELTLLSLDLAEVYVAREKHEEALELVEEFGPLLEGWGMHAEGLALWLLMQRAVRDRRAEAATFRQMAQYIARAWYRPIGKLGAALLREDVVH